VEPAEQPGLDTARLRCWCSLPWSAAVAWSLATVVAPVISPSGLAGPAARQWSWP